jgi:hypothetical protein
MVVQYILRRVTDRPIMCCTDGESALDYLLHRGTDVCYQLGVNSYMVKPMGFERLRYVLELLMRYWFSVVTLPARRSP